jgi:SAM-dependent methyltransferase
MTDNPIFISSPVDVVSGMAALDLLRQTNDSAWYEPGRGVVKVPPDRWQQAQQYEADTWLKYNLQASQDRNLEHFEGFGSYAALPLDTGKVIELGAGAFTNVRYILAREGSACESLTLLDPLCYEYLDKHPNCTYRPGGVIDRWNPKLLNHAIEADKSKLKYDTVVMVNTLAHCYDAEKVFAWINDHLKTGGYLVLNEPAREHDPLLVYDVGHPIAVTGALLNEFLAGYEEVYHHGAYIIGVKK